MERKKPVICLILTAILLSTFVLVQPAIACPQSNPQDITVQQAKNLIKHTPNILILDVRNESEYNLGHLNNAVLIPLHEFENRIGELVADQNNKIIVYCAAGSRSAPASQILADHGFTKVYNMVGGITAWMNADYSIATSYHHVTVDATGNGKPSMEIEPLLLYQAQTNCTSCQNQTCSNSTGSLEPTNPDYTILQQNDTYVEVLATYDINGTTTQVTIAETLLWNYAETTANSKTLADN